MKNFKHIKTFESFNTQTNEELVPIVPGPGGLGALVGPLLPFLIAVQIPRGIYDRFKFRKAKKFLGSFFEKIATDPVIKKIADGFTDGSVFNGVETKRPSDFQQVRINELQRALDRIKEISEPDEYKKFVDYMNYMDNNSDEWKKHLQYWPIFDFIDSEPGFRKRKTAIFDPDDTLSDLMDLGKKIASIF